MSNYDSVIIGKGPCGITCAIYLKRYGLNPIVIAKDFGSLAKIHKIDNYYAMPGVSGLELGNAGVQQAEALGIPVVNDEVLSIEYGMDGYTVKCVNDTYCGKTIMLSTGISKNTIANSSDFEAKGISYCAVCDGFFYKKKKVAIIGNGKYLEEEYNALKNIIPDLTVFTDGNELLVDVECPVVNEKIKSFIGDDKVSGIACENNTYPIEGVFIALGSASAFTIAKHMGIAIDNNYIVIDDSLMTNIPGVFAGGDCVGGLLQVCKASTDGAIAAKGIFNYLLTK